MVKQSDLVKPNSPDDCGSHGNTDDDYEEYSEEEMLSEEESNENLCMPPKDEGSSAEEPNEESEEEVSCGDESDDEDSGPGEPNNEDSEEPVAESAEYPTKATTLEVASDEDPSDVSYEEIIEEEFYEESDEEPNGEEPLRGSMDQLLVIDSDRVPSLLEENKASDHIFSESKTSAESCNQCMRESTNLSTDAIVSEQPDDPSASSKKRRSRWDVKADAQKLVNESGDLDNKRKTRWSSDTKIEAPILVNDNANVNKRRKTRWSSDETQLNCALMLPDSTRDILSDTNNDQHIQRLNSRLQEINRKLESGVVVNEESQEESSPSPQPIDVGLDSRVRLKLLKQKQEIISELLAKSNKNDKPKRSKHHCTLSKKLYIPLKEYPNYNFVGLLLGPNGNSMKKMEKETGASIKLRGIGAKDRKRKPSLDEMHVLIQSDSQSCLDAAVSMVEKLLVPVDDRYNYHKAAQLRELAELRGTLDEARMWKMKACDICGKSCHPTSDCPLIATASKANANIHSGSGSLFSSFNSPSVSSSPLPFVAKASGDKPKEIDPSNLFVGLLPQSVSSDKLKELFLPYGSICKAVVIMDKSTGRSKGCGFVKYTNASDAAKAIEKMNGYMIDGKKLVVRIAGISPPSTENLSNYPASVSVPPPTLISNMPKFPGLVFTPCPSSNSNLPNYVGIPHPSNSNANLPNYPGLASIPSPSNANMLNYPHFAAIPQEIPKPNCWPGPPGSMLLESGISFPENSCNSLTYTESAPQKYSTFLGSTFQTSLGKVGYMMDEKKLNVAVTGTPPPSLRTNLPNYPGFAAIPQEIPKPKCQPWPPRSTLPESGFCFAENSYNSLKFTESLPSRSSAHIGSTCQTSISSSQFPGVTAISNELASFPGYLKSFDPPDQLDQSLPSSSLSSRVPHFIGNFSGKQMNPTLR